MAIVTSNEYDHIDIVTGSNINRHMLKDTAARAGIDDLKSATLYNVAHTQFVQGARAINGGVNRQENRCTSQQLFWLNVGGTLRVTNNTDGQKFAVACSDGTSWVYDSTWQTGDFTITATVAGAYCVNVGKTDGTSNITPSEVNLIVSTMESKADHNAEEIKNLIGVREFKLTKNSRWPYFELPLNLVNGDKLHVEVVDYSGDVSNIASFYIHDPIRYKTIAGLNFSDKNTVVINEDIAIPRFVVSQDVAVNNDLYITVKIYVDGRYSQQELLNEIDDLSGKAYLKKGLLTNTDSIDTLVTVGFYRVFGSSVPTGWPVTGGGNLLVTRGEFGGTLATGICQILWGNNQTCVRFSGEGVWTDWQRYYSEGNSPEVTALTSLSVDTYTIKGRITGTTDIDTLNDQGSYRVSRDSTNTWAPVNWPLSGGGNLLVMKGYPDGTSTFGNCQIIYGANEIRVRFGNGGTAWTEWCIYKASGIGSDIVALNDEEETTLKLRQLSTSRDLSTTATVQPVTLLHFSDLHQNATALSRIVDFKTHYSSFINDAIHTGDTINTTAGANTFANVSGAGSILNVIGNHDTWDGGNNWVALTEAETNNRFISPFSSSWGNVSIPSGKCYYSKDYYDNTDKKNVVLIVLDVMHTNQDQLTWFTNTLNQAKSNGRHVIIANHTIMGKLQDMTYLNSGFDNPMYPRGSTPDYPFPMYIPSTYVDAVDAFVSGGGIVVAWLAGHMHNDTLATYHNILNIAVTTSGDYSGVGRTTDMRVDGTKSQDAFNVLGINTLYGHLYCMRVGLDYNAVMKKIDTFCWDYINHRMIYTC